MSPLLPEAYKIEPYIKRIDGARYYSNFGGLVTEFEGRLEKLFGTPCVTASSATSALTATLMALDLPPKSLIACPSWTFVATTAAIVSAGHTPYFVDVCCKGVMHNLNHAVATIVVVAPFGETLDLVRLEQISSIENIPIVIDAAAGFDSFSTLCKPGKCPVIISTHATKPFGTGEGGFVTCTDESLLKKIRHITNFGIESYGSVPYIGINGKMSEYHAAVGLAELDSWAEKREKWIQVKKWYGADGFASSSCPRILKTPAEPVAEKLQEAGIHAILSRYGVHGLKAYKNFPRTSLSYTECLMNNTLMLPMSVDMKKEDVDRVLEALCSM